MTTLNKFQERTLICALEYADERGWHILPVSKSKRPLIPEWTKAATTDERQIVKWWVKFPSANIGVLTGPESGFWVVDVDIREDVNGLQNLANYFGNRFEFNADKYLVSATATGGRHLLFKWDDDYPVKTTSKILPGVDTRGHGGQIVVAPSSRNIDGEWIEYRWNNWHYPISPMLPWSYEIIKIAGEKSTDHLDLSRVLTGLTEGERDEQLHRFACLLKYRDISLELAIAFLKSAALLCKPPFDPELAEQKAIYAYTTTLPGENKKSAHEHILQFKRKQ